VILGLEEQCHLIVQYRGAALSRTSSETTVTSVSATRHYGTIVLSPYDEIQDRGRLFKESLDGNIRTEKVSTFIMTH
jgi:hypothetical protein